MNNEKWVWLLEKSPLLENSGSAPGHGGGRRENGEHDGIAVGGGGGGGIE